MDVCFVWMIWFDCFSCLFVLVGWLFWMYFGCLGRELLGFTFWVSVWLYTGLLLVNVWLLDCCFEYRFVVLLIVVLLVFDTWCDLILLIMDCYCFVALLVGRLGWLNGWFVCMVVVCLIADFCGFVGLLICVVCYLGGVCGLNAVYLLFGIWELVLLMICEL